MEYILDRDYANDFLEWGYQQNPGPWKIHSLNGAKVTENILNELNRNGYALDINLGHNAALLHDIGRYKGFTKSVIHSYSLLIALNLYRYFKLILIVRSERASLIVTTNLVVSRCTELFESEGW